MKRVLLCAVLLGWSTLASAVVYKWVDADGKLQYGDSPPEGVHAEVVELLGTHASRPAAAPAPAPKAENPPPSNDVKKAVATDVAAAREKQCTDAQERYKKLIEGRHIYKTGDDGERVYLTSEQIDQERLDAKREVDDACNSQN
ncbi:MAG TPA: DUF4124 domain-containing protein [Steroidobacteraceae bacterium]|nr:DUF4124 domain-containing protein [Steroidobacteraceae bacterium]